MCRRCCCSCVLCVYETAFAGLRPPPLSRFRLFCSFGRSMINLYVPFISILSLTPICDRLSASTKRRGTTPSAATSTTCSTRGATTQTSSRGWETCRLVMSVLSFLGALFAPLCRLLCILRCSFARLKISKQAFTNVAFLRALVPLLFVAGCCCCLVLVPRRVAVAVAISGYRLPSP